jgi:chromosome segregation ATPase
MVPITERSLADSKTWTIKQTISQSGLDFILSESPFSLSIKIRKRFLQDRSQEISPHSTYESHHAQLPPTDSQNSQNKEMEQEITRLRNLIEEKDDEIKVFTATNKKDLETLHSLQTSLDQKTLQIQDLNSEINQNLETSSYSQEQVKILTDKLSISQKVLQTTKEKLISSQKQFQSTENKLSTSLKELHSTKDELSISQKELQKTKDALLNLPKQLQSNKDKLENSQRQLQSTSDKLADSKKQLKTTKDQLIEYQTLPKQLQSTKDKLEDSLKQLKDTQDKLIDSQRQIKNLNVETRKNANTIAKLKDNFAESQRQLQTTKDKLENFPKQLQLTKDRAESERLEENQNLKLILKEHDNLTAHLKPSLAKNTPSPHPPISPSPPDKDLLTKTTIKKDDRNYEIRQGPSEENHKAPKKEICHYWERKDMHCISRERYWKCFEENGWCTKPTGMKN